jgi:hypothetical protein
LTSPKYERRRWLPAKLDRVVIGRWGVPATLFPSLKEEDNEKDFYAFGFAFFADGLASDCMRLHIYA